MTHLGRLTTLVLIAGCSLTLSGAWPAQADMRVAQPGNTPGNQGNQIEIKDVDVRLTDHGPVVLLKAENRMIPIFVDATVAGSILGALTGEKLRRPLSHDLMRAILAEFGGKVTRVVITLQDSTYYGTLTVAMPNATKVFDSRSSDAIALAVHFKAPILVGRDLLESAGQVMPGAKELSL